MLNRSESIYYSENLKRQVVREYASGQFTKTESCEKYGILGSSTLLEWCKKYSTLAVSSVPRTKKVSASMKIKEPLSAEAEQTKQQRRRRIEQERISELEKALETSRSRVRLYLRIIELSSEQVGEDLLKKLVCRCVRR